MCNSDGRCECNMTRPPIKRVRRHRKLFHASLIAIAMGVNLSFTAAAVAVLWLHLGIQPVLSGSMRPTYGPGWIVITRAIPVADVRPGDIIEFIPPGSKQQYAHRVVSVSGSPRERIITTKGDANARPDPWRARLEGKTVPQVIGEFPMLGWVMVGIERVLRSPVARALVIGGSGVSLCFAGTRSILGRRECRPLALEIVSDERAPELMVYGMNPSTASVAWQYRTRITEDKET